MDIPPELQNQSLPTEGALHENRPLFMWLGLVGGIVTLLLILILIFVVSFEQQKQIEQRSTALVSPLPITEQSPTPSPILYPPYEPKVAGLSKEDAITIFLAITRISAQKEDYHLIRWEQPEITMKFRGQPTKSDTQCLNAITKEVNSVAETSKLVMTDAPQAMMEIYMLPRSQFTSVYVDSPPNKDAFIVYFTNNRSALSKVQMLVNSEKTDDERCWYMYEHMLKAIGMLDPVETTLPVPTSFIGPVSPFLGSTYSPYDLEMTRILYSPLLTSGLTKVEVERRLQQ